MLNLRGISYLIDESEPDDMRRDLKIIAGDLHCDTVMLISRDASQLIRAARCALDIGLDVHLRPRPHRPVAAQNAAAPGHRRRSRRGTSP